ncbi:ArdC-like ssDNA-binding domain-containing protein [Tsukamurella hominis]|uniref:ArdC-like ssDNA-binding domain-containing protein n=1 Tax=Tsukamurella hominis TaxID=1970232 RepID=UPI0039E99686
MTTTATRSTKRRSTKRRPGGDAATRAEQTAQLHATLTAAVEQLHQTDNWTNYLEFLRSFHRYSIRNVMLIMSQRPNATAVAGFRAWQEKGRQVRKGEKAIKIFGYSSRKVTETDDQGTETEKKVPIFPILSVFDISQTDPIEGHPLAGATTAPETPRLTGDDTTGIYDRLVQVLEARGWTIIRGETRHHAIDGTTTWGKDGTRTVTVRTDFDDAHAILTLIHEAAHVLMHDPDDAQNRAGGSDRMEVEAESVAYVVAGIYGLDAINNSGPYLASWTQKNPDLMHETAEKVRDTVAILTAAIDNNPDDNTQDE